MMRRVSMTWLVMAMTVLTVGVCMPASDALATDGDMARLPISVPNLCFACHVTVSPTVGDAELNPFGVDFLANGRLWDPNLANLDSDEDGCLNGVELGDSDGDGFPDGNVEEQAGNPGMPDDCGGGSLVDDKTWGTLKAMFDGR